jgi:ligand-binding sensor domain-containing protein
MVKFYKTTIFFLTLPFVLYPQSQDIRFEHISAEQGLSKSEIKCILQDNKGFMWFGSTLGLKKFDGYKFINYQHNPDDTSSLSSNHVTSLTEDRSGLLWIGTLDGGLNCFDRDLEKFNNYKFNADSLHKDLSIRIYVTLEDQSGKLWIGTNIGLLYFDRKLKAIKRFSPSSSNPINLINKRIWRLFEDQEGSLWLGTPNNGLLRLDRNRKSLTQYKHDPGVDYSLSNNRVYSIAEDNSGKLIVGTTNGFNKLNKQKNQFIHYFYEPVETKIGMQNMIRFCCPVKSGKVWIATGEGLIKYDPEDGKFIDYFQNINRYDNLKNYSIMSLYEDRTGIIWIGTFTGDIFKYDQNKMKFIPHKSDSEDPNNLNHGFILGICEDSNGNLWIGTGGGGLYKNMTPQSNNSSTKWINYRNELHNAYSISNNNIMSIYEDHNKTLWIGTERGLNMLVYNNTAHEYTQNQEKNFYFLNFTLKPFNRLKNHAICCILEDKHYNIWIGTDKGLFKYDRSTDSMIHYRGDQAHTEFGEKGIYSILESRSGYIWIGTFSDGLYKFDPERENFVRYVHNPKNTLSLSSNRICMIYEDKNGFLWIATTKGLNKFDPSTGNFSHYNSKFSLPDDDIYAILDDSEGNLWLSSVKGIFRFSPESKEVKSFEINDGLHSMEFNVYSYHKSKSGWMYFGGINGYTAFHPDSIKYNDQIPDIVLTDFRIFNKTISPGENSPLLKSISETNEVILTHGQAVFSFEFAALDFRNPKKNKYAYQMEGVDPEWVYTGASRRFATYTNLVAGEYIFRVKGSNNDGLWNEEGISVKVIILPPWWKTNWAYMFYVIFIGFVVFSIWRFQSNRLKIKQKMEMQSFEAEKLKEVDKLKSHFFANISHEFRTPLTLIKGPVNQMMKGEFTGNLIDNYKMILRIRYWICPNWNQEK